MTTEPVPTTPPIAVTSSWLALLGPSLLPTLLLAVYIGYNEFLKPGPQPLESPLVVAAKTYIKTVPDAYDSAALQVKSGALSDKSGVVGVLKGHAKPLADAMDAAFNPLCDGQGKILNAPAASDVLEQVAIALKKGK